MNKFRLEDCPKLGPYRLAKTRDGDLAIVNSDDGSGILSGYHWSNKIQWYNNGRYSHQEETRYDLMGPWDGKHVIGYTAMELADLICGLVGPMEFNRVAKALTEGQPAKPVWCQHIRWSSILRKWCISAKFSSFSITDEIADSWDECPVKGCHAKRPEGT